MAESLYYQCPDIVDWTADAAYSAGDIIQLPSGIAGQVTVDIESGKVVGVRKRGVLKGVAKTNNFVAIAGNRAYWDHSANKVNYKKVNDKDFYLGRFLVSGTAAGTDTTCTVELNIDPKPDIDLLADPYLTVPVGTQALGGFLPPQRNGGSLAFNITATSEAQKVDAISVDGFAPGANAFAEFIVRFPNGGSGSASDFSIGLANATHATNADTITDSIFFHLDGGSLLVNAECDDGTNETAATTTGVTATAGTDVAKRVELWIDMDDLSSLKFYVNGARVASGTTFSVAAMTNTMFILVHVEKTTGTETADLIVDRAVVRLRQAGA